MEDIQITDIVNGDVVNNEWVGTGIFDVLISAVNKNIEIQYDNDRIKGPEYAAAYMQGMQIALQQAIEYGLRERQTEVQVDSINKDIEMKTFEIENILPETLLKSIAERGLMQQQEKTAYVDRVARDKETATLGLDEVMKDINIAKEAVYTPKYEDV